MLCILSLTFSSAVTSNVKTGFHIVKMLQAGERILCRHPFIESKRAYVVPQHVEELLQCYWPGTSGMDLLSLYREFVSDHILMAEFRKVVTENGSN
jgi:hypothetical protein